MVLMLELFPCGETANILPTSNIETMSLGAAINY